MNTLKVILCTSIVCILMVCFGVTADVHVEYERSGPCDVSNYYFIWMKDILYTYVAVIVCIIL